MGNAIRFDPSFQDGLCAGLRYGSRTVAAVVTDPLIMQKNREAKRPVAWGKGFWRGVHMARLEKDEARSIST